MNSIRETFNVKESWYSPDTLANIGHGQALLYYNLTAPPYTLRISVVLSLATFIQYPVEKYAWLFGMKYLT